MPSDMFEVLVNNEAKPNKFCQLLAGEARTLVAIYINTGKSTPDVAKIIVEDFKKTIKGFFPPDVFVMYFPVQGMDSHVEVHKF